MVGSLLTSLDLTHMDMGGLAAARRLPSLIKRPTTLIRFIKLLTTFTTLINSRIENLPLNLFPSWPLPLGISTLLWFIIYAITFSRYHFCNE